MVLGAVLPCFLSIQAGAGTWNDHFNQPTLGSEWTGNLAFFQIRDGVLQGNSASPLTPSPFNLVEITVDSTECDVAAWINVVEPNTRVCTKGALVLRHTGTNGYVFALHEATQTIEVYRLGNRQMLLKREATIDLKKWYYVRAELRGPTMTFFVDGQLVGTVTDDLSPSGSVGLAVQNAEVAWFDDFTIRGPNITGNVENIQMPKLTVVPGASNTVVLRFMAESPYIYNVQASSTLFSHEWITLQSILVKVGSYESEVSDPITNGLRFYRIEKLHCYCR
jgi:hypothetical protein